MIHIGGFDLCLGEVDFAENGFINHDYVQNINASVSVNVAGTEFRQIGHSSVISSDWCPGARTYNIRHRHHAYEK